MAGFSQEKLSFFRHHLFLPPGLPQEDDQGANLDNALLSLVIDALWDFGDLISEEERPVVHHVAAAISKLYQTRDIKDGVVNEDELLKVLKEMSEADVPVTIPLHISAQNAGIIFSTGKESEGVLFQAFEVSPTNSAAMGTQGRLQRSFPGPVLCIDKGQFKKPDLLSTLAKTLSKMSLQEAPGMTPTVRKSGNDVKEGRDTTDPGLVTELIVSFLQPFSIVPIVHKISKNTREEILWNHVEMPWRRSPLWLLLRTVMQLLFTQYQAARSSEQGVVTGGCLYKLFMIYLLSSVLSKSVDEDASTEPDMLSCMSAKIYRRKLKLNHAEHGFVIAFVQGVLDKTQHCLEKRWTRVQELNENHLDLECLRSLEFQDDVSLSLPGLDDFISAIPRRSSANNFANFSPSSVLLKLRPSDLPTSHLFESADYMVYNLQAFEQWVASHLPNWLTTNIEGKGTCTALKNSMKAYYEAAQETYKGNPEVSSIMFLTILELWRACDESALALFPMLQDYDPDVQFESLQSLILPLKEDMVRLLNIEKYLQKRRAAARLGARSSIFRDFGTPDCFSVRFYNASWKHQDILQRIEDAATDERRERCQEFSEKKMKYHSLVQQYQQRTCDYYQEYRRYGNPYRKHADNYCNKCALKSEFESIFITVHEWPLPTKELEKKSVVFELAPPQAFCAWRDTTMFLLLNVLGAAYDDGSIPRYKVPLDEYDPLRSYHVAGTSSRIGLLSEDKPHLATHRSNLSIPYTTEEDVCVNNGLHYHYYDATEGCFVSAVSYSDKVPKMCTYQLPEMASTLQPFLFRRFRGGDSTPNEVISSQSGCPEHLSLEEYRYLADIPVCHRLQWKKILSQLVSPAVDFKKPETSIFIFQAIYQAGPREFEDSQDFQRASHLRLRDENFAEGLLSAVDVAIGRIKKNWESYQALSAFSCIVTRQLSLSPSPELTAKALKVLSRLRKVALNWLELLRTKRDDTVEKDQRDIFAERIVVIALICSGTFDVDDQHLERILSDAKDASILIQCGIQIHELLLSGDVASQSSLKSILHRRWERLSYRAYPTLLRMVVHNDSRTCLDHAVSNYWSKYQRLGCWKPATAEIDYWVVSNTDGGSGLSLRVHFNLLTGDLLVNGLPLSRPPPEYEKHASYVDLFGAVILQIMPSSLAGMQFSSKQCYADHSLHLGLVGSDLLVRAIKDDHAFELIPKRVFHGKIPSTFVQDFIHWYDMRKGTVEFRSSRQPWKSAGDTWILRKYGLKWILSKRESTLINPHSPTGEKLTTILAPLQKRLEINVLLSGNDTLEVDLPRLKLAFWMKRGSSLVLSRQFRGMAIDCEQSIGTLIGLQNKLVLKHVSTGDRRVIIPFGTVSFARQEDHVSVDIDPSPVSTHVYRLDTILKLGLRENGNLQSMLFLCYLHAITSFCLPDPLTCVTGTEKSLEMLKSGTVWSTVSTAVLTEENMELLRLIESLTPRRVYYPEHLQVMQTIKWSTALPVLSQHSQFHQCVMDLWGQNKLTDLYYPEDYHEPPTVVKIQPALLTRDNLRSSTFRISGYGAEDFSEALDVKYKSRDLGQSSKRSIQAGLAAMMLFSRRPQLQYHVPSFLSSFLSLLKETFVIGPDNPEANETTLDYDGMWLENHRARWAEHWCWLHQQSQSASSHQINDPQLMMWLATMAFSAKANMDIIQVAASLFSIPELKNVQPPRIHGFDLQEGDSVDGTVLRAMILPSCLDFHRSPEASFSGSASDEEWQRKEAMYEENKNSAIDTLKRHLTSQWPTPTPEPPSGNIRQSIYSYVDIDSAMGTVRPRFQVWYNNLLLTRYLQQIDSVIETQAVEPLGIPSLQFQSLEPTTIQMKTYISSADLFESISPHICIVPAQPTISKQALRGWLRENGTTKRSSQEASSRPITYPSTHQATHLSIHPASCSATQIPNYPPGTMGRDFLGLESSAMSKLESLIQSCKIKAGSAHERKYADDLSSSRDSLQAGSGVENSLLDYELKELRPFLEEHISNSTRYAELVFEAIRTTMLDGLAIKFPTSSSSPRPRFSPSFLLRQLSHGGWDSRDGWQSLPTAWKPWVVAYGLAITEVQRAIRLINSIHSRPEFERELENVGHENWNPLQYPESLLIEIESNIMIRPVQEQIAANMRQPQDNHNAVMQLNMGEGKSSVIAPIVTAALADGSRLVRVIVARPQSRQMFHMLVSKLGGLLNRRIFHLPFSRDLQLRLTIKDAQSIRDECQRCINVGGVMLVQPEHILSFKLMGLQSLITGTNEGGKLIGQSLLQTQHLFDTRSRDIVDESDENFSVKFELIYTMGMQGPIEFAPDRWIIMQRLLDFIRERVEGVREILPQSIEVINEGHSGSFPRIRFLKEDATEELLTQVAKDVCDGFPGFPIHRQIPTVRDDVFKYITEPNLSVADIDMVEKGVFWTETTRHHLLLLRGLFAGGILAFTFGHKRWRVNYGLDKTRRPATQLAVPYRAKDLPSQRSEFSHPDVVITLTCTCYYYEGLSDEELFLSFAHLLRSDQAPAEYHAWTDDCHNLPNAFKDLTGVNMKDTVQCIKELFPAFKFVKRTIDYFLQFLVFPKYMKEFPQKLSTSGWDIGAAKSQPTTGFSGTVDSRTVLPLDVEYLALPEQNGTNALVLQNLLRPENGVILLDSPSRADASHDPNLHPQYTTSEAELFLRVVVGKRKPPIRVILDVGAQILEMTNAQVATRWLEMAHAQDIAIQGAIFFDDNEELMVVDIHGFTENLRTSPYGEQLDACLVFLDEAHTRGTDLKLPPDYRAAVTLGASLTRDRLAQACMRMRKLGQGQSVVFCIPQEIQTRIKERMSPEGETATTETPIDIEHVLEWAISETHKDTRKSMPLWAAQGQRFERQRLLWDEARDDTGRGGISMTTDQANGFLEAEAQTIEQRYRPKPLIEVERHDGEVTSDRLDRIQARCEEVGTTKFDEATLQEEQERELSPEAEQERQLERPPPAEAARHDTHRDLRTFVKSGILPPNSPGFMPAFESLRETSAAQHLDVSMFPKDVLVTVDFARTVKQTAISGSVLDAYQRPVQWILTSQPRNWNQIVIVSPYEAHELLPLVESRGKTTLHIYAPRSNPAIRPLDGLDLYTVPFTHKQAMTPIPIHLKLQLNLFAGQLYFKEFSEYVAFCNMLRLSSQKASFGVEIAPDGFILSWSPRVSGETNGLAKSPVKFLKEFLTKARRDCQPIEKTHLGTLLDGNFLEEDDFESQGGSFR